jgi:ribosomal protein S18 acetylase RimI-like enzyme
MASGAFWPGRNTPSLYPYEASDRPTATVLWDHQKCIPLLGIPIRNRPVTLITPVVVPPAGNDPADDRDPFEIFGQSLSRRDIPIRHVPYTKNQGITGVHVAFIRRAKLVIFVITHLDGPGFPLQLGFAELVAQICESRPLIILACCPIDGHNIPSTHFRTLVHVAGYANSDLLIAASLCLDGGAGSTAPSANMSVQNQLLDTESAWPVRPWVAERDLLETCALWQECLPYPFHLNPAALESLLKRDGYALHYVVRDPVNGSLVGFCAAYATFADSFDVALVGSIAAVIVQGAYRGRGIGSSLHNAAMSRLKRVRGVQRLHLGSTFPRLLCGVPVDMDYVDQWFERRGWPVSTQGHEGQGGLVADWILRFLDLPSMTVYSTGLGFRQCVDTDAEQVLSIEHRHPATSTHSHGWYDLYAQTLRQGFIGDIIVAYENDTIVATAIIYTPGGQSPAASDIPWPAALNSSIGGTTCICIKGESKLSTPRYFIFMCDVTSIRML